MVRWRVFYRINSEPGKVHFYKDYDSLDETIAEVKKRNQNNGYSYSAHYFYAEAKSDGELDALRRSEV